MYQSADLLYQLSYTFLANMLHCPAGTVPITVVSFESLHVRLLCCTILVS
jgi:hypothetical protein